MNDPIPASLSQPESDTSSGPSEPKKNLGFWGCLFRSFLLLAILGGLGAGGFVLLSKYTAGKIANAFKPEQIAQTFVEWRELETKATDGNILEVATSQATEYFTRKTDVKLFDRVLPLGTTVSEISVPATYRFHIDLNGDWHVTSQDQRVLVIAPKIAPSLPVAFDTKGVQKRTKSGWARWDKNDNLAELERSVTATLAVRAGAPQTLAKVRNEARQAVAKFVQRWLLGQNHWDADRFDEIVIVFEDEIGGPDDSALNQQPATLRLDAVPARDT